MNGDVAAVVTALTLYLAVVLSPGPAFTFVSRMAVTGSRSGALGATLGIALGSAAYAVLTMAGLAVILQQVGWLARVLQIAGGLYLIYLGLSAWRISVSDEGAERPETSRRFTQGLRAGVLVCWSNPKAITFFVGLYGVAIPPDTALWAKFAILSGGFVVEAGWYASAVLLLSAPAAQAVYRRSRTVIERILGTILAGFGVRLLWTSSG
jgi:threonine/homoserine/homoserine lactone efflux protein